MILPSPLRVLAGIGVATVIALCAAPEVVAAPATPDGGADPYVPSGTNPMVPYGSDAAQVYGPTPFVPYGPNPFVPYGTQSQ
jgi:hypothetical protein